MCDGKIEEGHGGGREEEGVRGDEKGRLVSAG